MGRRDLTAPPLSIYLIRHGETEWSLTGQHTGFTDISLTSHGENEARELGTHLQHIVFARVLTSPLKRARQTCELVDLKLAPGIEPDLVEWDYGDYEGKLSKDIRKQRPNWDVFRDGCPEGDMPTERSGDRRKRPAGQCRSFSAALMRRSSFIGMASRSDARRSANSR